MSQPRSPWSLFLAVLRSPRRAFADVAIRGDKREGSRSMLVLGIFHAGFSLLLHLSGHTPKVGIPGIGRENHYQYQAIFLIPLYLMLFWIGGLVAHGMARRFSGSGSRDASLAVFGLAYAMPMLALFILPDIVVFLAFGFAAIGKAMRWYAPLAALACVWLGALGLSRAHSIGVGKAGIAALLGFVAQAVVGGVFLR